MTDGVVKKWFADRGYGFARPVAGGREVFLHASQFNPRSAANSVAEGTAVRWRSTIDSDRGIQAQVIELIGTDCGSSSRQSPVASSRPRTDQALLSDMMKVLYQLKIGRFRNGIWGYANRDSVLRRVNTIAAEATDPSVFLPALEYARGQAREHIDQRWFLLQDVNSQHGRPNHQSQEWGKYQDVTERGDHAVIAVLRGITGAPPAYEDENYEPEWVRNRSAEPGKRRWWHRQ